MRIKTVSLLSRSKERLLREFAIFSSRARCSSIIIQDDWPDGQVDKAFIYDIRQICDTSLLRTVICINTYPTMDTAYLQSFLVADADLVLPFKEPAIITRKERELLELILGRIHQHLLYPNSVVLDR